jgi:hypothetical protein
MIGDLATIPEQSGAPATILVDTGYEKMEQIEQVEQAGATVYCSQIQLRRIAVKLSVCSFIARSVGRRSIELAP